MFCSNCGQGNVDGSNFCFRCGAALQVVNGSSQLQASPAPSAPPQAYPSLYAPPQAHFPQYVMPSSDKSKFTAILLCCLGFIGFAGFHRLYVGKFLSGILYLITFGFLLLGTIIDLFLLLMGQFSDKAGQPIKN